MTILSFQMESEHREHDVKVNLEIQTGTRILLYQRLC